MTYIWYPLIKAIEDEYDTTKIHYKVCEKHFYDTLGDDDTLVRIKARDHRVSPRLEYLPIALYDPERAINFEEEMNRAHINPFPRFGSIFSHILDPERDDHNDFIVCDIIVHLLAHIDRICGMSKKDFHILHIIEEIENGCYGDVSEAFKLFSLKEKRVLAECLIMLYETSNCLRCLDFLFNKIMTDFEVRLRDDAEVVFYNPRAFGERDDKKLQLVIKLFLPINFPYVIHRQYTYGIVEQDQSMILECFVL